MQPIQDEINALYQSFNTKLWSAVVAGILAVYKGYHWVRDIREKDLKETNTGLKEVASEIKTQTEGLTALNVELQKQTTSVVNELKELRNDFRTFFVYPNQPQQMVAVRARAPRKPAAKRTAPKSTTKTAVKRTAKRKQ